MREKCVVRILGAAPYVIYKKTISVSTHSCRSEEVHNILFGSVPVEITRTAEMKHPNFEDDWISTEEN
jgi:hypothetical protein